MDIATGRPENHPTPFPYDPALSPALARQTPVSPSGSEQSGVRDLTGERLSQLASGEADARAAQSAAQGAENDRRGGYHADILPLGAEYGDLLALPVLPDNAVPPAMSGLYPYAGDEPVA